MKRRDFLATLPAAAAGPYLAAALGGTGILGLAGCSQEALSGPAEIKWDRDTCVRCSMVIGDKRFAAQVRDPNRKVSKFDDIGCALFWLAHQPFNEQSAGLEFWVGEAQAPISTVNWLDARKARYQSGRPSPMGYNFSALPAAVAAGIAETLDYSETKKRVLARGK